MIDDHWISSSAAEEVTVDAEPPRPDASEIGVATESHDVDDIAHVVCFYVLGDPQVGYAHQERRMRRKVAQIRRSVRVSERRMKTICLIPGDLTHHGTATGNFWTRLLCMCAPVREARGETVPKQNQLACFRKECLDPLRSCCGNVYMCIGNHDTLNTYWTGKKEVPDFVRAQHGGNLVYANEDDSSVLVISLSEYPTRENVQWMEKELSDPLYARKPFVVFFHYNLEGPYSDWWGEADKAMLGSVLRPRADRCAFIAVGHHHFSDSTGMWNGIHVVNGSGDNAVKVDVTLTKNNNNNNENEILDVQTTLLHDDIKSV
jgi:hypothetical protein